MWILSVSDSQGQSVARIPFSHGSVTVGRNANCTVVLTHPRVGPLHARLEVCDPHRLLYTDEGTPGGSRLNGAPVEGAVFLDNGKAVEIPGHTLAVHRIRQEAPSRAPVAPAPAAGADIDDPVTRELERQIRSIQSHREEMHKTVVSRRQQLDQGWLEVLDAARKLQLKLQADPRLQHFVISRDGKEVAVKLSAPGEKQGYRFFILAREHPDGKYPTLDAVWLREFGRDDVSYQDPQKAMTELVQRIAGTLA